MLLCFAIAEAQGLSTAPALRGLETRHRVGPTAFSLAAWTLPPPPEHGSNRNCRVGAGPPVSEFPSSTTDAAPGRRACQAGCARGPVVARCSNARWPPLVDSDRPASRRGLHGDPRRDLR